MPLKASAGACIQDDICGAASSMTAVTASATVPNRQMPPPTVRPAPPHFPSPIFCPSSTVTPMARPVMTTVTVCTTWLPVETAEMSAAAPNFPTTCRSTAPYMAWSNSASSTGRAKRSRDGKIGPLVKSCSRSIVTSSNRGKQKSRIGYRASPDILSGFTTAAASPPMNVT